MYPSTLSVHGVPFPNIEGTDFPVHQNVGVLFYLLNGVVEELRSTADAAEDQQPPAEPQEPPADTTEWMAIEVTLTFQINPEIQRTASKNVLVPSADYASALPEDSDRMKGFMVGEV
eukprot:SAG22_NODE_1464_length_4358_cov_537.962902_5_plen_117_part_00